jgi:hypothetical protein
VHRPTGKPSLQLTSTPETIMSEPTGGLPSGVDPSDPGAPNDSSLGADRAAAIEAEKEKWRKAQASKRNRKKPEDPK